MALHRQEFWTQTKNATNHLWELSEYWLFAVLCHFQHQPDLAIGVHLMDRYTFYLLEFLEDIHPASKTNMNDLVRMFVYILHIVALVY